MGIKVNRGGKRLKVDASGYYGNNEAGTKPDFNPNTAGQSKHIGSGINEYTFYNKKRGYLTVHADTFEEAWRQAKLLGYNKRNYRKR